MHLVCILGRPLTIHASLLVVIQQSSMVKIKFNVKVNDSTPSYSNWMLGKITSSRINKLIIENEISFVSKQYFSLIKAY